MDFDQLLQKLFFLTRVKVGDIAKVLNYDRTIISKWKNGQRLPSEKNSSLILSQMAHIFATAIVAKGIEEELRDLCEVSVALRNRLEVERVILGLLETSYYRSQAQANLEKDQQINEDDEQTCESMVLLDPNIMEEFLYNDFTRILSATTSDLNIFLSISAEELSNMLHKFVKKLNFVKDRTVTFHLAIDQADLINLQVNHFFLLAHGFLKSSYFDIKLYVYQKELIDEFIYFEGESISWLSYSKGGARSLNISINPEQMTTIFQNNRKVFSKEFQVIQEATMLPYENELSKPTKKRIKVLFSGFISSYFFPANFARQLLYNNEKYMSSMYDDFEKLFFENEIHAVITKTAVTHFIKTGRIQLDGQIVVLPLKYRIFILKRTLKVLAAEPPVSLYLLDDDNDLGIDEINVSFLVTDESISFFKDLENTTQANDNRYSIEQPELVQALLETFPIILEQLQPYKVRTKELAILGKIITWLSLTSELGIRRMFSSFFQDLFDNGKSK